MNLSFAMAIDGIKMKAEITCIGIRSCSSEMKRGLIMAFLAFSGGGIVTFGRNPSHGWHDLSYHVNQKQLLRILKKFFGI